ncbi:MAG: hypothetical protein CMJ64_10690, partial [Planctomycetaceae bacterium]|nr:hypothetical protein [Planctomycetaceae bacterium]
KVAKTFGQYREEPKLLASFATRKLSCDGILDLGCILTYFDGQRQVDAKRDLSRIIHQPPPAAARVNLVNNPSYTFEPRRD